MKGFKRNDFLLSLCGLNCGLCPMHLDGYCPGCGGGNGNQTCAITRCSMNHDNLEYCFLCKGYPCQKYENIDEYDSFITHKNQSRDFTKAKEIGIIAYNNEQLEKVEILNSLLKNYNDGRKKTFYCIDVNLLDLEDLKLLMEWININTVLNSLTLKEKAIYIKGKLEELANNKNIKIKLNKKPKNN